MERRKVLAAISAAIATPLSAIPKDPRYEKAEVGDPQWPTLGLTPLQAEVREVLKQRFLSQVDNLMEEAGPAAFADLWILTESLGDYWTGEYGGHFAGLLNCIELNVGRDRRFVAVPDNIHHEVEAFIEVSKASDETVIRVPNEIRETVALLIRSLCDDGDAELHIVIERGPHAVRPRRRNETRAIIRVEPWKDAPAGGAA